MPFLREKEPVRGVAHNVLPGISRLVARNPGMMTYHGTNTYLIEGRDGLTVLDPGPDDPVHVRDILRAAGSTPIRWIALSHTHRDHLGATSELVSRTGALTYAFRRPAAAGFAPDFDLDEGSEAAGLLALHTPGHASDHLSFAYHVRGVGPILFSGDHVMSWSSSVVDPPDGDMSAYCGSLKRLLDRDDVAYLPGHGALLGNPRVLVTEMLAHRQAREAEIVARVANSPATVPELVELLYGAQHPILMRAAERTVLAHLLKLRFEGVVQEYEACWAPV